MEIKEEILDDNCFYKDGLNFSCRKGCNKCCSSESGFVFLSSRDIDEIAKAVNLTREEVIAVYTREYVSSTNERMLVLKEYSNADCVFLTKEGCSIYDHRPLQCITYPFWDRILRSKEDWDNEAKECPGINSKDGHISKKDIDFIRSLFELPHCTLLK